MDRMIFRKFKEFVKIAIYYATEFFIRPSKHINSNSLLIIRLDAIGDYILFRNFLEVIRKDPKFKFYNITLLGNKAWKEIAEELDSQFIDRFIWIDKNKFIKNPIYRYKKLKEITSIGCEIIIHPTHSREFYVGDNIVKLVHANEKIGSVGDLSNIRVWQKKISDKYYSKLIPVGNEIKFEFYRNKEFFEILLGKRIDIEKPYINLKQKHFNLPNNYAILFIGASAKFRKWSINNFADIGKHLKSKYGYNIVLCGGKDDKADANEFEKIFGMDFVNLVGKITLVEFLHILKNADLLISNETFAPHAAVALGVNYNIFVISNGNHFGRFTPYPETIAPNYHPIYHPYIEKDINNYVVLSNTYGYGSKLDINEITSENVKLKIDKVLSANS